MNDVSPKEHELNMRILEGSFKVEGIALTDEAKKNIALLAEGKATTDQIIKDIISKYSRKGA